MQSDVEPPVVVTAGPPSPRWSPDRGRLATSDRPRRRRRRPVLPYLLVLPAIVAIFAYMAYPLYRMIVLTTHRTQLAGRFAPTPPPPKFVGSQNFSAVLTDGVFWQVVINTVRVHRRRGGGLDLLSLAVALLMRRVSGWARIAGDVRAGLRLGGAADRRHPGLRLADRLRLRRRQLPASTSFPGVNFENHSWFSTPQQGWVVITALVFWGAIPFLALTLYAGLTQVPTELIEAATIDGANSWQVLRSVTLPILQAGAHHRDHAVGDLGLRRLQPDLGAAQRPAGAVLLDARHLRVREGVRAESDYNTGAAISMVTMLLMLGVMVFYIRQMIKIGEAD